jgi:cytochrome c556
MRKKAIAAGVGLTLAAAAALGATADIDYSDFDDTLMRSMDDAIKDLDSNLGGQDTAAALANTQVLSDGLSWAEKYFAGKPQAPLGAGYAREARQHLDSIVQSIQAKDFDAATTNVRAVVRTCKACHEAYKPPE